MKLGKIKISDTFVLKDTLGLIPIFSKFVPIHIERELNCYSFIYTGVCEDFDELKEGEDIPFFTCVVTTGEKHEVTKIEFKKLQP